MGGECEEAEGGRVAASPPSLPPHGTQSGGRWVEEEQDTAGQENRAWARAPRPSGPVWSGLVSGLGASQELHPEGDPVVPGHRQDAHKASQEGRLEHVPLVGVIVKVPWENLETEKGSGRPPPPEAGRPPRPPQGAGAWRGLVLTLLPSAPGS